MITRTFLTLILLAGLSSQAIAHKDSATHENSVVHLWSLAENTSSSANAIARSTNLVPPNYIVPNSIIPNHSVVAKLAIGSQVTLALPDEELLIQVLDVSDNSSAARSAKSAGTTESGERTPGSQQIISFKVLSDKSLPEGAFFIHDQQLSGWIPTANGSWRVEGEALYQEMKWASEHLDHKLPPESSIVEPDAANVHKAYQNVSTDNDDVGVTKVRVLFVATHEFIEDNIFTDQIVELAVLANNAIYHASNVELEIEIADIIASDLEPYTTDQILDNLSRSSADDSTAGDIPQDLLEPIWQARFDSQADIISVLTHSRPNGLCGRSWLNGTSQQTFNYRFAVNVVSEKTRFESGSEQSCSLDTLGHEIGHNMGLAHSLEQGEEGTVFHYGRGYGVDDLFTTVMAYPQSFGNAVALPTYSSPELECLPKHPCGVDPELDSGADAVTAVNNVRLPVSRIHNESVTLPVADVFSELDPELADCIEQQGDFFVTNEELRNINCAQSDIESFEGVNLLPRLRFLAVNRVEDVSLEPFKRLGEIIALDFRFTRIEDLRPLVHLREQLQYLRFFADNMSCQDENVIESWGIEDFIPLGNCLERDDDEEDFDSDGINNLNDTDDDNDGIDDLTDALPFSDENANDIDADGVPDDEDAFPYDPEEYADNDHDTLGNNEDEDDDNDGVEDTEDCAPFDPTQATGCETDAENENCVRNCSTRFVQYDYDGDGKADVGVRRASNAFQYILNSSDGEIQRVELGKDIGDVSISGDFDGDKIADLAVRRPGNHFWYIKTSSDNWQTILRYEFGLNEDDIPVPADYDGDGITDIAVRRPAIHKWFILNSSNDEISRVVFGRDENDIPVPADYDGDGKADIAVRRPGNQFWYILRSSDGEISRINFGLQETDIPVPADYDGDGITDIAVRRPSNSTWYVLKSSDGEILRIQFGMREEDIPIVADYDGDGRADVAVRRPSERMQYILRSSDLGIDRIRFGLDGQDIPLAAPVNIRFNNDLALDKNAVSQDVQGRAGDAEQMEFQGIEILSQEAAAAQEVFIP